VGIERGFDDQDMHWAVLQARGGMARSPTTCRP
jgi:hypothetical protein